MNTCYFPENYSDIQDGNLSIVNSQHQYDFTQYSRNEAETIGAALRAVRTKYPFEYKAIGLANEAEATRYKPRYILFEMLIQRYSNSASALDKLAVAYAYQSQGARSRQKAIEFFENSIEFVDINEFGKFLYFMPLALYNKFSKLYEQQHEWDKAIQYLLLAKNYCDMDLPYYKTHLAELKDKKAQNKPLRCRRIKEADVIFEKELQNAANIFLRSSGL